MGKSKVIRRRRKVNKDNKQLKDMITTSIEKTVDVKKDKDNLFVSLKEVFKNVVNDG